MLGRCVNPSPTQLSARGRSLTAFFAFAGGIGAAMQLPDVLPGVWFGLACVAAGIAQILGSRASSGALTVALAMLGAGISAKHLGPWPSDSLARELPVYDQPSMLIEVEGIVTNRPEVRKQARGALSDFVPTHMRRGELLAFRLDTRRVKSGDTWRPASGVLLVSVSFEGSPPDIRAGRSLRITGAAELNEPPANPGDLDFRLQKRDLGRVGFLSTSPDLIRAIDATTPWDRAQAQALALRAAAQSASAGIIERATQDDPYAGPVVRALIMGEYDHGERDIAGAFRRVGLLHLLSVSGFHVAVAAALALLAIRLTGDRGWVEPAVVCLALGLYVMLVPMRAPIFRASVLVLAMLLGDALGRRHDRISVVCWIGIVWLALRPSDLLSIGFQLSFGITWWLMLLSEPRRDALPILGEATTAQRIRFVALRPIRTAAACWSLAMPAVIFHTGIVSPLAVLATIVTVPLIIASMWLGFLVLVLGSLVPALAPAGAVMLRFFAGAAARTALWFESVPMATLHLSGASLAWTVCATAGVIWIWRRARLRDWRWGVIVLALAAWLSAEVALDRRQWNRNTSVHMLAVGDASALVVRSVGQAALWDCGSWRQDVGRKLIPDATQAMALPRVETVFITHANIDHYMGVLDVLGPLGVRQVITGESFGRLATNDPESAPAFVLAELARRGIEHRVAVAGDVFRVGDATLRILHPPAGFVPRAENDASLMAMLEPPGDAARVLLTGDAQREAMAMLMESGVSLNAGVIELPHHGSAHDASYGFVAHVNPAVVLQSTGPRRLDDPRWDAVRTGRTWLVTARHGMSSVYLLPDGSIRAQRFR